MESCDETFSYPCLIKDAEMTRQSDSLHFKLPCHMLVEIALFNRLKSLTDILC